MRLAAEYAGPERVRIYPGWYGEAELLAAKLEHAGAELWLAGDRYEVVTPDQTFHELTLSDVARKAAELAEPELEIGGPELEIG